MVENLDNGVVNLSQELNIQINDENGNNNQEINPGEYIQLSVPLTNFGNTNLTSLAFNKKLLGFEATPIILILYRFAYFSIFLIFLSKIDS